MKDNDFKGILAGLDDAISFVKGDASRARVIAELDVKAIRERTRKSQPQFAKAFHIPIGTLRDWEQGRRMPDAPARVLLSLIDRDPETVEKLLTAA
ncbi:transcriptional regulator [Labrys miyagiensis]|uniref:Transcriptional regulator n=1 Tax=Labrys miyagiensis TaxID=346912 RepID=A0ABQ6CJG3_9HYPH|nr:transcriptional regulator [Labrys miyagiensis]GLS19015.1 transcriptional regulator [Labrys miyagiensis]